jgi:predicted small metal-binding protein
MDDPKNSGKPPVAGSNPNEALDEGAINPSAPSTDTANWGNTPDERRAKVGQSHPDASSSAAQGAGDVRHTSYPQNETAQNPASREFSRPGGRWMLHCADAVKGQCVWSVTADSEEEVLGYLRAHVREAHGKNAFTADEMAHLRKAIHKRAA